MARPRVVLRRGQGKDSVKFSYAINDEKVGTYVAYEDHLRQPGVAEDELQVEEG